MESELERLLAIEEQAERLVAEAESDHRERIAAAREEAGALERRFEQDASDILAHHLGKAEARAEQTIAELQRHYEEYDAHLRSAASEHHAKALAEALRLFQRGSESE